MSKIINIIINGKHLLAFWGEKERKNMDGATVRKSLQGLDYIAADGAKGFEALCVIVESLKEKGLNKETAIGWEVSLKEGKQYFHWCRTHIFISQSARI